MAKETDGRSRATMNEADLEYLRNINPNKWVSREDMERAQSDAKPALPQTLRDAAENLLIAIGMGWDLNGCAENLRALLAQPNAEPDASAGLIEAAEYAGAHADAMLAGSRGGLGSMFADQSATDLKHFAKFLRARAADRSKK